ncbi:hypothetical protein, partial [Marinitenerispora sediminis]
AEDSGAAARGPGPDASSHPFAAPGAALRAAVAASGAEADAGGPVLGAGLRHLVAVRRFAGRLASAGR